MKRPWPLLLALPLAGCLQKAPPPAIRYTVGAPYLAGGTWRYPEADFSYDETGIATVYRHPPRRFTADGERYSPDGFTAAHPSLELPAMARITNLGNGRQIVVRINDRGPANPARILAVTPRVASLLGFPAPGLAAVRVQLLPAASEALALSLPGGPRLALARAPVGPVQVSGLPPLPGAAFVPASSRPVSPPVPAAAPSPLPGPAPGTISNVAPAPGALFIRTGIFTSQSAAFLQRASLARFGAEMIPRYPSGTLEVEVRIGPFASVAEADGVLKQVLAAGASGARLVVK